MASAITRFLVGAGRKTSSMLSSAMSWAGPMKIAGYTAAGLLGRSYLSNLAEQRRNYYGDSEYEARYKGGIESAATLAPYVGFAMGLSSAASYGPIGIARRAGRTASSLLAPVARGIGAIEPGATKIRNVGRWLAKTGKGPKLFGALGAQVMNYAGYLGGSFAMTHPVGTAAVLGAGNVAAWGTLAAHTAGGMPAVIGFGAGTALAAGVGVLNATLPMRPAGEGYITDVRNNAGNTVRKMDFNTAGLVQALHARR